MKKIFITSFLILLSMAMISGSAYALSGVCSNCHTMHNSQDGAHMQKTPSIDGTTPKDVLLRGSCLGCHTGTNNFPTDTTPYVNNTAGPGTTLAGGNFYWAQTDYSTGHNILNIGAMAPLTAPPGYDVGRADAKGQIPGNAGVWTASTRVTCAGQWGCHGKHDSGLGEMGGVSGGHHANSSGSLTPTNANATTGNSYRFLIGIHGYEDTDYEYTASDNSTDHNQYKGVARTTADLSGSTANITISWLCGECHGEFHSKAADVGASSTPFSPWLRHPTDLSFADVTGTEYASYNNAATSASAPYSVTAPVGTADVSAKLATVNVTKTTGTAIVTCISCHRAHGSPYSDLLRWNYNTIVAGGGAGNVGCFICHTTKD